MPDTRRDLATLLGLTPDNTTGDTGNNDLRDMLVTALWWLKRYTGNISGAVSYNYATNGGTAELTLIGNVTSFAVTGMLDGDRLTLTMIQDGTGSRTLAGVTGIQFEAATSPTLTTTPGRKDVFSFYSNGTNLVECARAVQDVG